MRDDALRDRVRRLVQREVPEVELEPPELGGERLVVPSAYAKIYGEGYEPKAVRALRRLVRPGHVCADLGANVGFFSLLMARLAAPGGRVVAFEPREDMAGFLERNVAGHPVAVTRAAVTEGGAATVELHSGGWGTEVRSTILAGVAEREEPAGRRTLDVPAVALDDCFGPGDPLDVVKVDVEGAESVVLRGAARVLAHQRPVFVVEYHGDVGWPVVGHLAAAGYRFKTFDGTRIDTPATPSAVPSYIVALPE
jgi:FkbM family methyltransferase